MSPEREDGPSGASRRAWLEELIEREGRSPRPLPEVLREIEEAHFDPPQLQALLAALAEADRERLRVALEAEWFRRFGWRLMRPLLAVGVAGALLFLFQHAVEPTLGLSLFLLGAAALFVVLQLYVHRWSRKDLKRRDAAQQRLRTRLEEIRSRLDEGGARE